MLDSRPVEMNVLDARDLPAKDRGLEFHRLLRPLFESVPTVKGADYRGRIEAFTVGDYVLTKSRLGAATFERSRAALADGTDMFGVQVYVQGHTDVSWATHSGHRGPGGLVIVDTAQPVMHTTSGASTCNLSIPRRVLGPLLQDPDAHHGRFVLPESPLSLLALEHFRAVFEELPHLTQGQAEAVVAPTVDLIAATLNNLGRRALPAPEAIEATEALKIRRYVACHFTDPSLSVGDVSNRLSISRSRLAQVFKDEGGLAAHIQRRRLLLAKHWLLDPMGQTTPVADIRARAGFGSDATFYRAFKDAFGMSPREFQQLRGGEAPQASMDMGWLSTI